jgi:hypothetical protein
MKLRAMAIAAAVVGAALGAAHWLGVDLTDAATVVPGGADKLGSGVQDAGKTVETTLVGYAGPAVTIGAGLAGAAAANRGGAGMGGSAASGLGTALIASFIPIAGTSTYTTSGSAGATHLAARASEVAWYADGFVWLSFAAAFIALTVFRELRRLA